MSEAVAPQPGVPVGPPSGGGIGSQAVPVGVSPPASPPAAQQSLEQMTLAAMGGVAPPAAGSASGLNPGAPVGTPAAPPVAGPTVAELQAQIATLQGQILPAEELRTIREFAQIGQQTWLERQAAVQQQQAAAPAPVPAVNPYAPDPITGVVPFSEAEERMLIHDDTVPGGVKAMPGAPPGLVERWHQHQHTARAFLKNLTRNPIETLNLQKLIQDEARKIASGVTTEHYQQAAQQQAAEQIGEQNKTWIYQKDASGQPLMHLGKPALTEEGSTYLATVERLYRGGQGLTDPVELDRMAKAVVLGMVAQKRLAAQHVQQAQAAGVPAVPPVPPAPVQMTPAQQHALYQQNLLAQAAQHSANAPLATAPPVQAVMTTPTFGRSPSLLDLARTAAGGRL